ncbi:MAG: PilZ domain-containing protein [Smithellaceae bacterium]
MTEERRKRTRVPVAFDVNILFQNDKIKVQTTNLSLTGICCISDPRFRANVLCDVILTLNEDATLAIAGKFLRVDEKEAIVAFLSMDEDTFSHLKRIIEYNALDADKIVQELKNPAFTKQ